MGRKKLVLSVVIPAFNESAALPKTLNRLTTLLDRHFLDAYEIIVVNDGSTDSTERTLADLRQQYRNRLKSIHFSRNFGHQPAVSAGLDHARGEVAVCMDADLQQPPGMILKFWREYQKGADIVLGVRMSNDQQSPLRRKLGDLYYFLFNKLSGADFQPNVADFGLYSRTVYESLRELPEKDRYLRGLVQWIGFTRVYLPYRAARRVAGVSKYSTTKTLSLAATGITSFSVAPLRLSWVAASLFAITSVLYAAYVAGEFLLGSPKFPPGWPTIVTLILLLASMQFIILGVFAEYLAKIYIESKRRPSYIIKKKNLK